MSLACASVLSPEPRNTPECFRLKRSARVPSNGPIRFGTDLAHGRAFLYERVAGPHVHHEHTDALYVLERELTFEIGREAKTIRVSAGGFVAAPPQLAHSFQTTATAPRTGSPSIP
jgi:mannose-6-phosphate isomerase-like protein (cupin superfamily)